MGMAGGSRSDAEPQMSPGDRLDLPEPPVAYPLARWGDAEDDFHGVRVLDPFRWLEDADGLEATDWVDRQNALTSEFLRGYGIHDRVAARLRDLWSYPRSSLPLHAGRRTFVLQTDPLQEQPVLYAITDGSDGDPVELINPNAIAADGTAALTGWVPSPDGALLAYAISRCGSDRQEIQVREIETGMDFPEVIRWTKSEEDLPYPNIAWRPDSTGFYYNRLPAPGTVAPADAYRFSQVYRHRVGTPQDEDLLIFDRPDDPDLNFVPIVTDDGQYLLLHVWKGLSHRDQVLVRPIDAFDDFISLFPNGDARYLFMGNVKDRFYFHTNASAPHGRVIGVDLERPAPNDWTEIVPEGPDAIVRAALTAGRIVLVTVRDAHHGVATFNLDGTPGAALDLPNIGTVSDLQIDPSSGELLLAAEAFLQPRETLRFDPSTGDLVGRDAPEIRFDPDRYETRRQFFLAQDGTRIPITLVHRRGLRLDGKNPVLLYGYGGFNVSLTPQFDASRLLWLEAGGVYAMANLRGGGEHGEAWHEAGMLHQKQTVFNDFIAAAQWLIDDGFTTPSRLVISAESNGGLLVAACMLQRPDLFAAVVSSIPVTDMLRYPRFTIGRYWVPEYGDAEADADDFQTLYAYSPLHNVRPDAAYPPILVTTGASDDRVVPAHAMKFVAALQIAAGPRSRPRLLRVQRDVGHGLGKSTSRVLELDADIYSFAMAACGMVPVPSAGSIAPDTTTPRLTPRSIRAQVPS